MRADQPQVVVTGLGVTTPVGGDVPSTWASLLAGHSGARRLPEDWAPDLPVQIAAPAAVDPATVLDRVQARRLDRCEQLAIVAAREAWADAGKPDVAPERLGVVVSSGVGGIISIISGYDLLNEKGWQRLSPFTVPMLMANGSAGWIGLELNARAGVHTTVSACASGAEAIGYAIEMIRSGRADVVVAGGTEAAILPLNVAAFSAMRALSTRNDEPERASRPFDRGRDGFLLGEGAGIVVLESLPHAVRRGAEPLAEVAGYATTTDAYHMTAPDPDGKAAERAMRLAMEDAGLPPDAFGYLNAHGTSTPYNDKIETAAIKAALGAHARKVAISSTKSMTGHLLGAAGGVEFLLCVLAIREGVLPPTINYRTPDPECDLDCVPNQARPAEIEAALSNSMGFGGHNVTLAVRRYRE